ncbi:magnesium/cobalt transporter CorA [Fundidesulfovibrio agrisoli]|uniref:magnesium/cobalt transporter CorA n=1 Tax=Fundidesulfovibrio agrisoli TaxID=2922717 RepID=UPI001FABDABF|nr:magnesium/cobalt transporter CorA [Fundidesulfovibrio agrisoli]
MFEQLRRRSRTAGRAPGTPEYVGVERSTPVTLQMITYDASGVESVHPEHLRECACFSEGPGVSWINIDGLHDPAVVSEAAEVFKIHPLVVEDIVHTGQRPKMEELGDSLFVIIKMLSFNEKTRKVEDEQVSFILGSHYLLTFQEHANGDVFGEVRKRIMGRKGRVCSMGADYLLYALMDAVVDNYFVVLERMGEEIEDIEEMLLSAPKPEHLEALHGLRREALFLRKYIFPLREVVAKLEKGGNELISDNTIFYLRDLYDHTIQVMDTVETFRDMLSGMVELYLSNISLKMNEIMKVLTMFSSFFIPLTFIAGLYGMNFKFMPELEWEYGYFAVLALMATIGVSMLLLFRRKGWIGKRSR